MRRIFDQYAYSNGPREGCWWDETCAVAAGETLCEDISVDVAIVGGGFTGVSAALRLASSGVNVALLEAHEFGWGASGRNGGFCCLGGGIASDAELEATFGFQSRLEFRRAEKAAVGFVAEMISTHGLDADLHSRGETQLAHRPRDMKAFYLEAARIRENYGVTAELIGPDDLALHGMGGGPFFGALTIPIGFGLNPRKYLSGLVKAALSAGARLFSHSTVYSVKKRSGGHLLRCPTGTVAADQVIFATNGYSSEDLPDWLAGRYMPSQSTILVTAPLTGAQLQRQGWTTDQMCYDTRNLLHYFRLMPNRRFLFGMRGGLLTGPRAEVAARRRTLADFQRLFPQWADLQITHSWSGMVALARKKLPFVGAIPKTPGHWAAMCFHGNGVAMGSYAGKLVADLVMGKDGDACPLAMRQSLARFPFGRARRLVMPPLYAGLKLADTF